MLMVLAAGLEPAQPCDRGILSPLRLPIPPREHIVKCRIYSGIAGLSSVFSINNSIIL